MNHTQSPSARPSAPRVVLGGLALLLALGLATAGLTQETASPTLPARPVAVWPPAPLEVIATFEHPVSRAAAQSMVGRTIAYEEIPPDRPAPPAASGPAGRLRIVGARLQDDGRTLVIATDPHPRQARYLLPLPSDQPEPAATTRPIPAVSYDLSGAMAVWSEGDAPPGGDPKWSAWWPSLDLDVTRKLTRGSGAHEAGWPLLARPGHLLLSSWIRLPTGKATLTIRSTGAIEEAFFGDAQADAQKAAPDGSYRVDLSAESRGDPLFLTTTIRTGADQKPLSIRASYRMAGGPADHPIDRDRLGLPWSPASSAAATPAPLAIPDLSGGDPARGRTIFRGDQARCSQCHLFRGEGGQVGPDLTSIANKGRAEIYRNIAAPSAVIEPDYTTYTVATRDGQVLSGIVRAEGPDVIKVTDTNAKAVTVRRDQIQEIRPSATSIMPPGLAAALGNAALRDLIAYLTSPAPAANPSPR